MAKNRMNATLSNCNFQIKFEEQNLKSAWPCAFIFNHLASSNWFDYFNSQQKDNYQ